MPTNEEFTFTPKQQRMLEFVAAYLKISTAELTRRIVVHELNGLEEVMDFYADPPEAETKPGRKPSNLVRLPQAGKDETHAEK